MNDYSPAWFETFARGEAGPTEREVAFLLRFSEAFDAALGPCWGNLPVPPDPLHWSADADRRLRRRASFGFFDDATNEDVLAQMAEKTREKGVLVLDVYDPVWFRAHQGPHVIERNGSRVEEHKRVDGDRLHVTLDYEDGTRDTLEWRLYEAEELRALAAGVGLICEAACAGFNADADPGSGFPRMQLVFRRR